MGVFDRFKKKWPPTQDTGQKYAISLISGHYEMRPPDVNLWCIGSDYKPCVVVVPLSAWEQMNSIITLTSSEQWARLSTPNFRHSRGQKLIISVTDTETGVESSHEETTMANCGFKNLYTDTPIFLPVLMPVTVFNSYFIPIDHYLKNHSTPPKTLAQGLLHNVEFMESDESPSIPLIRRAKNLRRCDKYSRFPNGDKIEIFETYSISNEQRQQEAVQPVPAKTPELPYVGSNLDALQKRVTIALRALSLVGDSASLVNDFNQTSNSLNRLQDEAKRQRSKVTRLVGSRETAILQGAPLQGTPYPLMAILPGAMLDENASMLWVPGQRQFYRVVAYRGHGSEGGRKFDGNTFIFDEKLLTGADVGCCMVDEWGSAGLLPRDRLITFVSRMQAEVHPAYKAPLIIGNPADPDSWQWAGQAQEQEVMILGNIV